MPNSLSEHTENQHRIFEDLIKESGVTTSEIVRGFSGFKQAAVFQDDNEVFQKLMKNYRAKKFRENIPEDDDDAVSSTFEILKKEVKSTKGVMLVALCLAIAGGSLALCYFLR